MGRVVPTVQRLALPFAVRVASRNFRLRVTVHTIAFFTGSFHFIQITIHMRNHQFNSSSTGTDKTPYFWLSIFIVVQIVHSEGIDNNRMGIEGENIFEIQWLQEVSVYHCTYYGIYIITQTLMLFFFFLFT